MGIIRATLSRTWSLWAVGPAWITGGVLLDDWFVGVLGSVLTALAAGLSGWIAGRWHQERAATARVQQIVMDLETRLIVEQGALLDCRDGDWLNTGG